MKQHPIGKIHILLLLFFLSVLTAGVFLLAACGGGGGGSDGSGVLDAGTDANPVNAPDVAKSGETGGIAFNIDWGESGPQAREMTGSPAPCDEISLITAEIYDASDNFLAEGGPWPCEDHTGTVSGVPAGNHRQVLLIAENEAGEPIYWGEAFYIDVLEGQTSDAGTIMAHNIDQPLDELLYYGLDNLKDGENDEMLNARIYFKGARVRSRAVGSANEADAARFFHVIARLMSLYFDQRPDGTSAEGLMDLGDVLDAFGYGQEGRFPVDKDADYDDPEPDFPDPLLPNSPTSADLKEFLDTFNRPILEAALTEASAISQNFNYRWTENLDRTELESDYGDVLFGISWLRGALAGHHVAMAYETDEDLDEIDSLGLTLEQVLNGNPDLLTLTSGASTHLNMAKSYAREGLKNLDDAIVWMMGETDAQSDDWINLDEEDSVEIDAYRADIADYLASLDGPRMVGDNEPDGYPDNQEEVTVDASRFFAGLNFRSFLPNFSGDEAVGFLPDPTFEGIIGNEIDLNEDEWTVFEDGDDTNMPDGTADFLQ